MSYPVATIAQIASFKEHGRLVVEDAIPGADLDQLEAWCDTILERKESLANDWGAWRKAVTNHLQEAGAGGEGDPYRWKITVNQRTGERITPKSRLLGT